MKRYLINVFCTMIAFAALTTLTLPAADKVWNGSAQDNNWNNSANWTGGAPGSGDRALINTPNVAFNITADTTVLTVVFSIGASGCSINIASGKVLTLSNSGGSIFEANESVVINGPGGVKTSTGGSTNYADWRPAAFRTITINAPILANSDAGIENNGYGIIVLNNPNSDFTGQVISTVAGGTIIFPNIANKSVVSSMGKGTMVYSSQANVTFRFVGTTASSTDRTFELRNTPVILENAGTAALTWSGTVQGTADNGNAKTFILTGDSAAPATLAGAVINGNNNTLSLTKRGSGNWAVTGTSTATGTLAVEDGTLTLSAATAFSAAKIANGTLVLTVANGLPGATQLTMLGGVFKPTVTNPSLGGISVNGTATIDLSQLSATANLPAITIKRGGLLQVISSVPLFISGATAGIMPLVTLNGVQAAYDTNNGLVPYSGASVSVPAKGPYAIATAMGTEYVIDSEGSGGGITLQDNPTTVLALKQNSAWAATVDFNAGQSFSVDKLAVAPAAAALTLGTVAGQGTVVAANGTLVLDTGSDSDTLTLYAAVSDVAPATPTGVAKLGNGEAVLHAPTFTGSTAINDGILNLAIPNAATYVNRVSSGVGTLAKSGAGTLLATNATPDFIGPVEVREGTLLVGHSEGVGLSSAKRTIKVMSGGALDVGGAASANSITLAQQLEIVGSGVNGRGALLNSSPTLGQNNVFQKIKLTGDASVGGDNRIDLRVTRGDDGRLEMNGNKLSKVSTNYFAIVNTKITPDTPAAPEKHGTIGVLGGTLSVEYATDFGGSAANELNIGPSGIMMLYGLEPPINWTVNAAEGGVIRAGNLAGDTLNTFAGTVNLSGPGATILDRNQGGAQVNFNGKVTGNGGLHITNGIFRLMNPANDYSGNTVVSNSTAELYAATPDALPGLNQGKVSIVKEGTLAIALSDNNSNGWSVAQARNLLSASIFNELKTTLKLDTGRLSAPVTTIPENIPHGLQKIGAGTLVLKGNITAGYRLFADEGTIDIQGAGPHSVGYSRTHTGNFVMTNAITYNAGVENNTVYLGDKAGAVSYGNLIGDTANFTVSENGYGTSSGKLIVGAAGHAVLDIKGDAHVAAPLIIGRDGVSGGAIYQSGNSVVVNSAGSSNDGAIGQGGYGHYWLQSGSLTNKGYTQVGKSSGSYGIFRQSGGTFVMPGGTVPYKGVVGENYGGNLVASRAGYGAILLLGGEFFYNRTWAVNNDGNNDSVPVLSVVSFGGDAYVKVSNGSMDIGRSEKSDSIALINFWGNSIWHGRRIYTYGYSSQKYVNFNGGTFKVLGGDGSSQHLFNYNGANQPTRTTLYGAGATFDVPEFFHRTVDIPLAAPTGNGLADFDLATPLTGYYAPPFPVVNGHGGVGGFVDTVFDRNSGAVTGFRVHSPGWNYPENDVTVTLKGGGAADTTVALQTKPNVSGGLTKTGAGVLTLTSPTNTYCGVTRVLEGTLALGTRTALPALSTIEVGGSGAEATLSLNGHTITNANVTLKDGGRIINGSIIANKIRKLGSGRAELSVPTEVNLAASVARPDDQLIPGFQEGMLRVSWLDNALNPGKNVQLTTVAGNGALTSNVTFAEGRWNGNNHTWIYTGYVWNRTATNETWKFRASFDDNVSLWIDNDGAATISRLSGAAVGSPVEKAVTPGAHLFRIYFGDGTGSVGNKHSGVSGLEVDFGDGLGWRALADSGNGSRITVSKEAWGSFWRKLHNEPSRAGLWEGLIGVSRNTVDPNPCTAIQQTTRAANGTCGESGTINGFNWPNHTTAVYSGYIWNHAATNVTWTFTELFDDTTLLVIDGNVVLNDTGWSTAARANYTLTPGSHLFEVRFGQAGGGAGLAGTRPGWWPAMPSGKGSFLVDFQGRNAENIANYQYLENPESGLPILTTGPVLPGSDTQEDTLVVEAGTLALTGVQPGLYEGMIRSAWDASGANPKTSVRLTTRAGNIPYAHNTTSGNPAITNFWADDNHTYIYSGYLWNRTSTPVTWTFWGSFDDHVMLKINGVEILHDNNTAGQRANVTLNPGANAIEIRFGDGSGSVGPRTAGLPGGLSYTTAIDSTDPADYNLLIDPGDGSLLTTELGVDYSALNVELKDGSTLDLGGNVNNVGSITGNGTINNGSFAENSLYKVKIDGLESTCMAFSNMDISNLTVVPADAASATPTHHTYIIATGPFTGKPTLEGFSSKYKLQSRGNGQQLVLTSQGGTLLMLR